MDSITDARKRVYKARLEADQAQADLDRRAAEFNDEAEESGRKVYALYKGYVAAGFTEEQAYELIKLNLTK